MKTACLLLFIYATCASTVGGSAIPTSLLQVAGTQGDRPDAAEEEAFQAASQQKDVKEKAARLESFLARYPGTARKEQAVELLLDSYEALGNTSRMITAADRRLQINPNNLKGLWTKVISLRYIDGKKQDQSLEYSMRGLDALRNPNKPQGVRDADFEKMKSAMSATFNQAAGLELIQRKQFSDAQRYLSEAVHSDPNNFRVVYPLALAYLHADPPNTPNGLFFLARAAILAPTKEVRGQIEAYGKKQCATYYASDRPWDKLKALVRTQATPPTDSE